jgi:hypothetical protein
MEDWTKNFRCLDCYDTGFIPDSYSLKNIEGQKCTNKIHDMEKSTLPVLLKTEDISKKFDDYKDTAAKYDKYAVALTIENADKLAVASNNVSQIGNALKTIEDIRKLTQEPYFNTVKAVNNYAKILSDPLDRIKTTINSKITAYKVMQEAQAKIKRDQETAKLQVIANDKKNELARITTIQNMVNAMLYGGDYINMKGESKSSVGCKTIPECETLRKVVYDKFPTPALMKYCTKEAIEAFDAILEWISEHKSTIEVLNKIETSKSKDTLLKTAMFAGSSNVADQIIESNNDNLIAIHTETVISERKLDKEVANAKKGVRRTLRFTIIDAKLVPDQFKTVDESLVGQYIADHKEDLFKLLEAGKSITELPGINVYVYDQNISK